jgi:hypothetical protein
MRKELVDARALHGRELIERWQLQAGHFPQRFRVTVCAELGIPRTRFT